MENPRERTPRGGNRKATAPADQYYTAAQARKALGMNESTFYYYVKIGEIQRHQPRPRANGYYLKRQVDKLATKLALFMRTQADEQIETRTARPEDTVGIAAVLDSLGWQHATPEQRTEWYKANKYQDFVLALENEILGYVWCCPLCQEKLTAIMDGRVHGWDITPADILPYESGGEYEPYIGIAVKKDIPGHVHLGAHLIAGFLELLQRLATQGIIIRRLYGVSDEEDGIRLARKMGFEEQAKTPEDMSPPTLIRFALDLEKATNKVWESYQQTVREMKKTNTEKK